MINAKAEEEALWRLCLDAIDQAMFMPEAKMLHVTSGEFRVEISANGKAVYSNKAPSFEDAVTNLASWVESRMASPGSIPEAMASVREKRVAVSEALASKRL